MTPEEEVQAYISARMRRERLAQERKYSEERASQEKARAERRKILVKVKIDIDKRGYSRTVSRGVLEDALIHASRTIGEIDEWCLENDKTTSLKEITENLIEGLVGLGLVTFNADS